MEVTVDGGARRLPPFFADNLRGQRVLYQPAPMVNIADITDEDGVARIAIMLSGDAPAGIVAKGLVYTPSAEFARELAEALVCAADAAEARVADIASAAIDRARRP